MDWRHSNVISSKAKRLFPKENSVLWLTVYEFFSKHLIQRASGGRIHYWNPTVTLDLQNQKIISSLNTVQISLSTQLDSFVYRFDLETTILASCPSKILNYRAMNLFLQKLSTFTSAKFITFTRTQFKLQPSGQKMRAITMRSTFTSDRRYEKSNIKNNGNVYCPNEKFPGKPWVQKNISQFLQRQGNQCPQCVSTSKVHNNSFEQQDLSISSARGFVFLKRLKKQSKILLEMCIAQQNPTKNVSTIEPTELLVSTTAESKPFALTCLKLPLRNRNPK